MKQTLFALIAALILAGCENSTETVKNGTVSLSSAYDRTGTGSVTKTTLSKGTEVGAVDSIRVTRIRMVLRDIKLKSSADSINFRTDPMVIELNLSGAVQTIALSEVLMATYRRVEFDVHRVQAPEISRLPASEQPAFADFLADERYSVIINGTVYRPGQAGQAFTYRSKVNAKQKIDLDPQLVVSDADPLTNVTLSVSSEGWFRNQGGALVDPTDRNSEGVIDENIKRSIKVFKDKNRDGQRDTN